MEHRSAIIIGSGVAGLALATRLAIQGYKVKVFEKNSYPGGKLSSFSKDGFQFDAGPSLFTQPQNIEELFLAAGEDIRDYFSYKPVDVACRYFFENGKYVTAYTDAEKFATELEKELNEPAENARNYLSRAETLYNSIGKVFLNYSLHKRSTWLHKRILKALGALKAPYLLNTLQQYNAKKFKTAEAQQIFNRFATYNGSSPYKAPAMLSLIPHLEMNQGVFYPAGGMVSITHALYKLAQKKGVQFFFDTSVQHIVYTENRALGIVADGNNILADIVISNADTYFTYKNLLHYPSKAEKLLKQERSSSAIIFYWGISQNFNGLGLHNILFSGNYQEEFQHIFTKKTLYADPTVYINITSKEDKSDAPPGSENWFVMINVPANTGQDWEKLKSMAKQNIIGKINRMLKTDIEAFILSESILDPLIIEAQTGSFMGSLYGTSSNSKLAAFFRKPNFTSQIKNLYFCGGSVHPGGGIPLCLKSAEITASIIAKDQRVKQKAAH